MIKLILLNENPGASYGRVFYFDDVCTGCIHMFYDAIKNRRIDIFIIVE